MRWRTIRRVRDAAQGPGVPVVDLAAHEAGVQTLVAVEFGSRTTCPQSRAGTVARVVHRERLGHDL